MQALVEVAVDSLQGALVAQDAGAGRIELCAALDLGGVTPSLGLVQAVRRVLRVPLVVLVRPRAGAFEFLPGEQALCERDIAALVQAGVDGVVVGALEGSGRIDRLVLTALRRAAQGVEVVFHRAFDQIQAKDEAWVTLTELGITRVLTAGGPGGVGQNLAGLSACARLAERGGPRLLPGGGLRRELREPVLAATGAKELHTSARTSRSTVLADSGSFGRLVLPDPAEIAYLASGCA